MPDAKRHGTQSIERAVDVVKAVASRGRFGWGLRDLAGRCELDEGTTHRILGCLVRERLVLQRARDRHYLPGPMLYELGLGLPEYATFQAACRTPLASVSKRFAGLAFLYLRSDADLVCAGRVGDLVYQGLSMDVGSRRPLLSSAGGVAMLIGLPQDEAEAVVAENVRRLGGPGNASVRALQRMLARSQALGYAFNQSETARGIHAFGVAVNDPRGTPFASVTVVATADDLPATRGAEVAAELRRAAQRVEQGAKRLFDRTA